MMILFFVLQMGSTSAFMMPSTSSDVNSWIARSQISSSDPPLPAMIDPSTNPEYRRQRDNCFSIFDEFTEDEQVLDQLYHKESKCRGPPRTQFFR
jgi:hypothetical protein